MLRRETCRGANFNVGWATRRQCYYIGVFREASLINRTPPDAYSAPIAMKFQLDTLTESELIDLNRQIVERLRLLQQTRALEAMLEFRIGDRVQFNPDGGAEITGMLTRYNKKTVTVITDDGHHWNVAPSFLKKSPNTVSLPLKAVPEAAPTGGKVVPIKKK